VNTTDKSQKKPIETIRILADVVEEEVSGSAFDHVLVNHFAEIFDNLPSRKHKTSIRESVSAMIKLNKECNKLKEVLSANKVNFANPFFYILFF
jgi:molecular chaperone DnaK (HSP70)